MDKATIISELATLLSDTLSQVSDDRLTQAVDRAWRDPYVVIDEYDKSLTYDASTYEYTVPTGITNIESIYVQYSTTDTPEPIDAACWEVSDGKIRFNRYAFAILDTGDTLHIRGKKKLASGDSIPADNYTLIEYVINLSALNVLRQLSFTKALSFLKNDTSMAELIGLQNNIVNDVNRCRAQLQKSYADQ